MERKLHPDYAPRFPHDEQAQKSRNPLDGRSGFLRPRQAIQMVEVGGIEPPSEGTPSPALHA